MFRLTVLSSLLAAAAAAGNFNTTSSSFNLNEANKNVYLSAAAYCGVKGYDSHEFSGLLDGFVLTRSLKGTYDVEGFVGYLPSDKTIYVAFRGSSDIQNWIADLEVTFMDYEGDCCGTSCRIHKGFYQSAQSVFADVLDEVRILQAQFPSYSVRCTGHSLGAALAVVTAMDLSNSGIQSSIYNFGQPRVGDAQFASCSSSKITTERVTHLKDTVPHVPFESWGYVHGCREAYESTSTASNPQVKDCSTSDCDDPTCAEQWEFKQTNVDDHLLYLGLHISNCNL